MALRGPGTRRTAPGDPEESIKVAVMDKRSGRSGGYKLKGPLECKRVTDAIEAAALAAALAESALGSS
jgi:hypothetical protein